MQNAMAKNLAFLRTRIGTGNMNTVMVKLTAMTDATARSCGNKQMLVVLVQRRQSTNDDGEWSTLATATCESHISRQRDPTHLVQRHRISATKTSCQVYAARFKSIMSAFKQNHRRQETSATDTVKINADQVHTAKRRNTNTRVVLQT